MSRTTWIAQTYSLDQTETYRGEAEAELRSVTREVAPNDLACIVSAAKEGRMQGEVYVKQECGCFYGWLAACQGIIDLEGDEDDANDGVSDFKERMLGYEMTLSPLEKYIRIVDVGDTPKTQPRLAWLVDQLTQVIAERSK